LEATVRKNVGTGGNGERGESWWSFRGSWELDVRSANSGGRIPWDIHCATYKNVRNPTRVKRVGVAALHVQPESQKKKT